MPTKKAAAKKPAPAPAAQAGANVEKRNYLIPKDVYDTQKDAIKAPIKQHGLKWQYLGEGKGRYHKEGVNLFVQFQDDGVHYALWGSDAQTTDALVEAWRALLGEPALAAASEEGAAVVEAAKEEEESDALRLWRLQEPHRRPGEPDFFFEKRLQEWRAKKL